MQWPYQWHFSERFLRYYDDMRKAQSLTAAIAIDSLLDKQDHALPFVIQSNSRVPDNRRSS